MAFQFGSGGGSGGGAFGAPKPAFGAGGGFRQPAAGGFGQPASGGFGQPAAQPGGFGAPPQQGAFGAPAASAFGQPAAGAFGSPKPFGQAAPAFGAPAAGAFGQPAAGGFGAPTGGAFGQAAAQPSAFGAAPAVGGFGSPQPVVFGAAAPAAGAFGAAPAAGAFGAPAAAGGFGGAPAAAGDGSRIAPWAPTQTHRQQGNKQTHEKLMSITAMSVYQTKSFAELQFEDRTGGGAPAAGGPPGFGAAAPAAFGAAPAAAPAFGAAPAAFGAPTAAAPAFGAAPAFAAAAAPAFGAAAVPAFGAAAAPAFGAAPAAGPGIFGAAARPAPAFAAAAAPALGAAAAPAFGAAAAPAFGAPAAAGGLFGAATAVPGGMFGAPAAAGAFGAPAAAGGLFAAAAPKLAGGGMFGVAAPAALGSFGSFGAAPALGAAPSGAAAGQVAPHQMPHQMPAVSASASHEHDVGSLSLNSGGNRGSTPYRPQSYKPRATSTYKSRPHARHTNASATMSPFTPSRTNYGATPSNRSVNRSANLNDTVTSRVSNASMSRHGNDSQRTQRSQQSSMAQSHGYGNADALLLNDSDDDEEVSTHSSGHQRAHKDSPANDTPAAAATEKSPARPPADYSSFPVLEEDAGAQPMVWYSCTCNHEHDQRKGCWHEKNGPNSDCIARTERGWLPDKAHVPATNIDKENVKNFTVEKPGVGRISWCVQGHNVTDVSALDLSHDIKWHDAGEGKKGVDVYPDAETKPPRNSEDEKLNKPCVITLFMMRDKKESKMRKLVAQVDAADPDTETTFVAYNPSTGELSFQVPGF